MNKLVVTAFIVAVFFTFTIGQVQDAYDRVTPQVLYLSIINLSGLIYILSFLQVKKVISNLKTNRLFLIYFAYILISGISIIVADNKPEAIITYSRYLTFFLTFVIILLITNFSKLNFTGLFLKLLLISIFIESSAVVYNVIDWVIVNGNEFARSNDYRSFSANINITAFSLVMKSPVISYYLFKTENKYIMILCCLLFFITSSALFFLLTRGAFLAFILITVLIFSYKSIKDFKASYKKILITIIVFMASYQLTNNIMSTNQSNVIVDRVSSIRLNTEDESINQRLRFYSAALNSIRTHPILGLGLGNWKFVSIKYDSKEMTEYTVPYYAHNDFLQIAAEIGLIGMVLFLYFIFAPFFKLLKRIYLSRDVFLDIIIFAMISVYIIDSMLNFPINRPISHILMIFVIIAYMENEKKLQTNESI